MIQLDPSQLALRTNRTYSVGAAGGTAPYVWTFQSNQSGGTVTAGSDSSQATYAAGPEYGVDVIRVTDSGGSTATMQVGVDTVAQLVGDIVANGLGLGSDQVWQWDQKVDIPTDSRLYCIISVVSERAFGQSNFADGGASDGDPLTSVQGVNIQARIGIDILSRGNSARDRKDEVLLALNSDYAETQQELNQFFLGKGPMTFINLSQVDGAAIPYRFHIEVNVLYAVTKRTLVPYFDTFETPTVTTEP